MAKIHVPVSGRVVPGSAVFGRAVSGLAFLVVVVAVVVVVVFGASGRVSVLEV